MENLKIDLIQNIDWKHVNFQAIFSVLVQELRIPKANEYSVECEEIFNRLYPDFKKINNQYHRLRLLILVIIYMVLRKDGLNVKRNEFLRNIGLDKKKFRNYYKLAIRLYPEYQTRDKEQVIINLISQVKSHFKLNNKFLEVSKRIFQEFSDFIEFTKEEISTGLISKLTMIRLELDSPNTNEICKFLGISAGNLNNRVKNLMVNVLRAEEFITFKKSSDLIREMITLNEQVVENELIEILFKNKEISKNSVEMIKLINQQVEFFDSLIQNKGFLTLRKNRHHLINLINVVKNQGILKNQRLEDPIKYFRLIQYINNQNILFKNLKEKHLSIFRSELVHLLNDIKFISKYGISQYFKVRGSTTFHKILAELVNENVISEFSIEENLFIILPGTEETVKNGMKEIKLKIFDIIVKNGPIKPDFLRANLKKEEELYISRKYLRYLLQALVHENKVFVKELYQGMYYYSKLEPNHEARLKRVKNELKLHNNHIKLKPFISEFHVWIRQNHDLDLKEERTLQQLLEKCEPYLLSHSFTGRSRRFGFQVFCKYVSKREINNLLNNGNGYGKVKPWLHLHEIFSSTNHEEYDFKSYQHFRKVLLNDRQFCNEDDRKKIIETPDIMLRMQYLLNRLINEKRIIKEILIFIKKCFSGGYSIIGKDFKGFLAAAAYLHPESKRLRLTYKKLSTELGINTLTIRERRKELERFIPHEWKLIKIWINNKNQGEFIGDFLHIIEKFKKISLFETKIRELIDGDYKRQINSRLEAFKEKFGGLHYDLLNKDKVLMTLSKMAKQKDEITDLIKETGIKHKISDHDLLVTFFKLILEIVDFTLGDTLKKISKNYGIGIWFVLSVTRVVFSEGIKLYRNRFYHFCYFKEDMLLISEAVKRKQIDESSFKNLLNPQIQDILEAYRQENQKKGGESLFRRAGFNSDFTRWIYNLSKDKLKNILRNHIEKLSIPEFLFLCSQINQDLEILKCITFNLINTPLTFTQISKVTGKSRFFISKYAKLIYEEKIIIRN